MTSIFQLTPVLLPALGALSELKIGDTLPALTLKDQHDQPQAIGQNTRFVIFTREKDASNLADDVLKGQTAETLQAIGIRYVADISKMPGLVTSMFAMPKLRKYPYPVLLGRTAEETSALPREPGKVTVIEMDGATIKALHFIDDATALRGLMGLAS